MISFLPEFLMRLRASTGLSLKTIAQRMRSYGFKATDVGLSQIELRKTASPTLDTITGLSKVFNRPVEDFVMASQGIDPDNQPKDTDKEAVKRHLANIPEAQRREFMAMLFAELIGVQLAIKKEIEKK